MAYIKLTFQAGGRRTEGTYQQQLPFLHPKGSHTILPTVPLFHFLTADLLSAAVQADK